MSQINQLDAQAAAVLGRLRAALDASNARAAAAAAPDPDAAALRARIAALEGENADLVEELERLRAKRDKDVAALDELISQLKPLIEEV